MASSDTRVTERPGCRGDILGASGGYGVLYSLMTGWKYHGHGAILIRSTQEDLYPQVGPSRRGRRGRRSGARQSFIQ